MKKFEIQQLVAGDFKNQSKLEKLGQSCSPRGMFEIEAWLLAKSGYNRIIFMQKKNWLTKLVSTIPQKLWGCGCSASYIKYCHEFGRICFNSQFPRGLSKSKSMNLQGVCEELM